MFGSYRNNAYLCLAKMTERYEMMPPLCGFFLYLQIYERNPQWGGNVSGNSNVPVVKLSRP